MRVLTFNLLTGRQADGPARHRVVKRLLPALDADVVGLQEAAPGQARDLLGPDFTIVDLPGGDPVYGTECLASRFPVAGSHSDVNAVALEIAVPEPVLVVHHKAAFERDLERVREQQALATTAFVDGLVADRPDLPVVLLGDFNAAPDTAGMRFLTGRQSLAGSSVHYEDAWEAVHGDAPGDTFTPRNPLVRSGEMPLERGRRIDHILIRGGARGPLLDVADCRLVFTEPVDGVWASDHFGVLAELRRPS